MLYFNYENIFLQFCKIIKFIIYHLYMIDYQFMTKSAIISSLYHNNGKRLFACWIC